VGSGAVYVIDSQAMTDCNVADESRHRPMSAFDMRLHTLSHGDSFDMCERRPLRPAVSCANRAAAGEGT
jgi:cyanophycinase